MKNEKRDREERRRAGFTLIEVMLVVIILGILATVVAVSFKGRTATAKINATRTSIKNVCTAIDLYELEVGKLPGSLVDLTKPIGETPPPIKGGVPKDLWGVELQYTPKGKFDYELRSAGPDAQMGSEDDITN